MPRIAVIEDDILIQREYRLDFEEQNATDVEFFSSKAEALSGLRRRRFDGAIIDLNLSDDTGHGEGLEILEYLRKCQEETVCFVVSATSVPSDINKSWKYGANDVVVKSEESFYSIVSRIVQKSRNSRKEILDDLSGAIAALSNPEIPNFWESSFYPYAGGSFDAGRRAVFEFVKSYFPLIRPRGTLHSFRRNEPKAFLSGHFWSKAVGEAIYVEIGDPDAEKSLSRALGDRLIGRRKIDRAVVISVYQDDAHDRDAFMEFWHDKPDPSGKGA